MRRLIDANELLDSLNIQSVTYNCIINKCIEDAPTVDAVEVVRCKDCKHLRIDSDFHEKRYCSIRNVNGGGFCKDEDYCSYGERREEGEA